MSDLCDCCQWACGDARLYLEGNGHHPNCEKYERDPAVLKRFSEFGEAVWKLIERLVPDFFGDEWSEEILPLAEAAGLCHRLPYDPEKHGDMIDADPGDEIWFFTEKR